MAAWQGRQPLKELLAADPEVTQRLSAEELERLFDYGYYVKHIDAAFQRLGLLPGVPA
jgi:adenylosuccinate lyase